MPEKITILKDGGESLNTNIVSVFMIPESGKSYIITTENAVDPHGLTVLHVSEIQGDKLVKVETDDEWSSIKTIMRAIISSSVGSYQYLPSFANATASGQYSRDISVSAPAAKQLVDSYNEGEKQAPPQTQEAESLEEAPAGDSIFPTAPVATGGEEVAPGIAEVAPEKPVVVEPTINNPTLGDVSVPGVGEPVSSQTETETAEASEPSEEANPEAPAVSENAEPVVVDDAVADNQNVTAENDDSDGNEEAEGEQDVSIPVIEGLTENEEKQSDVDLDKFNEINKNIMEPMPPQTSLPTGQVPVSPQNNVAPGTVVDPNTAVDPNNQGVIDPNALVQPMMQQPINNVQGSALQNLGINIDFNSQANLGSKASLDEIVAGAQELFQEGVKNLMMVMSERIYKDLRAKEEDLRRREIVVSQREQAINESTMALMNNNYMQQPMMQQPMVQQPVMQQPIMQQPIVQQPLQNPVNEVGVVGQTPVQQVNQVPVNNVAPTIVEAPNDPVNPQT